MGDKSPEPLVLVGQQIKPDVIAKVWDRTRQIVAGEGYAVDDVAMPQIVAITLDSEGLQKAWKDTARFPNLSNQSEAEWGEHLDEWQACTFPTGDHWLVLVYERMRPIKNEIRHELLHIWESLLGLQWGTLTRTHTPLARPSPEP